MKHESIKLFNNKFIIKKHVNNIQGRLNITENNVNTI